MSDLISRKKLLREINRWDISRLYLVESFKDLVKEQPAINQYENLIKKIKGELKQSSNTEYICESCKIISTDVGYVEEWFDEYIDELEGKDTNVPSKWIPCNERLPEDDGRYLCDYGGGCVDFGLVKNGEWDISGAIAWMPLPHAFVEGDKE